MATYYVDLANGSDSNAGTSWGAPLRHIDFALGYAQPGDEVRVAKSYQDDLGGIAVTEGSKRLQLTTPVVMALHDQYGSWNGQVEPNWYTDVTISLANSLGAGPTIPSGKLFIALRANAFGSVNVDSISINGATAVTSKGRPFIGSETYSYTDDIPDGDFVFFDMGTSFAGQILSTIKFNSPSGTANSLIEIVYMVTGVPSSFTISATALNGNRTTGTINQVLGPNVSTLPALPITSWCISSDSAGSRGNLYLTGTAVIPWRHASGTYTSSVFGACYSKLSSNILQTMPGVNVTGGWDTSLNIRNGTTRFRAGYGLIQSNSYYDASLRVYAKSGTYLAGFSLHGIYASINVNNDNEGVAGTGLSARRATFSNIDLSTSNGPIDGETPPSTGYATAYLLLGQTNPAENGLWSYFGSATWVRTPGMTNDGNAKVGNEVAVSGGTYAGKTYYISSKTGSFGSGGTATFTERSYQHDANISFNEVNACPDLTAYGVDYSIYVNGSICPTRLFINYRSLGPQTYSRKSYGTQPDWDSALNSCSGWSSTFENITAFTQPRSFTSSVSSFVREYLSSPLKVTWSSITSQALNWSFGYQRNGAFSSTGTGSSSFGSIIRDRGFNISVAETLSVQNSLNKQTTLSTFNASATSFVSKTFGTVKSFLFGTSVSSSISESATLDKGMPFTSATVTDSVWSFGPTKVVELVAEIFSAVSSALDRDRGYSFTSTNDLSVAPSTNAERPVETSVTTTSATTLDSLKRIKEVLVNTILVNSAVATISTFQNKKVQSVVSVVSSITHSPAINRMVSAVSSVITGVVSAIGRTRPAQFVISAVGTSGINFTRLKSMAWDVAATLGVAVPIRKATKVLFSATAASTSYFANNTIVAFLVNTASSIAGVFSRNRPVATSLSALTSSVFGTRVSRENSFTSSSSTSSTLSLLRNRGYSFTIPMSHTMTANLARLVGEHFVANSSPVISVVFGKEQTPVFTVVSQSGNTMVMAVNRPYDLVIGEAVTVDGFVKVSRTVTETFGSSSGAMTEAGVRRGVQFTQNALSDVSNAFGRLVPLAFVMEVGHNVGVSSNGNRLDEYFVQYEEPRTYALGDGTIVVGSKRLVSSGIRQNQHPIFGVVVPAPEVIDIIVKEDD